MHTPEHLIRECEDIEHRLTVERLPSMTVDVQRRLKWIFLLKRRADKIDSNVRDMIRERDWEERNYEYFSKMRDEMTSAPVLMQGDQKVAELKIVWESQKGDHLRVGEHRLIAEIASTRLFVQMLIRFLRTLERNHQWNAYAEKKIPA